MLIYVSGAVEGSVDEAVLRRLIVETGAMAGPIHVKNGKTKVLAKIHGYNFAAERSPWVVLLDLDNDGTCAPPFVSKALASPSPYMCLRVAVHEIESWLLADRVGLSRFLSVARSRFPSNPDAEQDPKRVVVGLARRSRKGDIAEDLVPRPGSGRREGPAYSSRLIEFVLRRWNPREAALGSDSLSRAIAAMSELVARAIHLQPHD